MRLRMTTGGRFGRSGSGIAPALLGGVFAFGCQGADQFTHLPATTRVNCTVSREECGVLINGSSGWACSSTAAGRRLVRGDLCVSANDPRLAVPDDLCRQEFCTHDVNAPGFCALDPLFPTLVTENSNLCTSQTTGFTQLKDVAVHSVHPDWDHPNGILYPGLPVNTNHGRTNDPPICVPPHRKPISWLRPESSDVSKAVHVGSVIPNSPDCTAESDPLVFSLPAGTLGTATSGSTTVNINGLRANAKVGRSCFDEICVLKTLDVFQADIADMTISGIELRKLRVDLATPAPLTTINPPDSPPFLGVAPGALRFRAEGQVNGVDRQFTAVNQVPFRVDAATNFRLLGNLDVTTPGPGGNLVTIRFAVNSNGAPATPQQADCMNQSGLERLYGFEEPQLWTASPAQLSLVTSPVTQGCGGLGVRGSGFMPIVGAPFSTVGLATNNALSVDLFIPTGQPNPFYTGALQMHLSCPSGGVNNQYIGQVELTGKPLNQYSTLRFPLPQAVRTTLARPLDDCFYTLSLNANPTGNTWILDRLRFTP